MRYIHQQRFYGDRDGIRTQDPQLRRLLLYPAELPDLPLFSGYLKIVAKIMLLAQKTKTSAKNLSFFGNKRHKTIIGIQYHDTYTVFVAIPFIHT